MKNHLKRVLVLLWVVILLLTTPLPLVFSRDYAKQLSDTRDFRNKDVDIKTVFVKDDRSTLTFKTESWKNWNLEDNNVMYGIFINALDSDSESDCRYLLGAIEDHGSYFVALYDSETHNFIEIADTSGFSRNNPIGIMSVKKASLNMKNSKFSFSACVMDLSTDDADNAPDEGLCHYKPGPSSGTPKLNITDPILNFGQVPARKTVTAKIELVNDGEGILKGSLTSRNPELEPTIKDLELDEYETKEIAINLHAYNLPSGDYTGQLDIKTNGGDGTIPVKAEILHEPELDCDSETIDFGTCFKGERKTEKLRIKNRYSGPIKGNVKSKEKWLIISKDNFEDHSNDIALTLNSKNLDPGAYETEIDIYSDGGNKTIPVTVEIVPLFQINVDKLDFGSIILEDTFDIPSQFILIKNNSDDEQTLKIEIEDDWIKTSAVTLNIEAGKEAKLAITVELKKIIKPGYLITRIILSNKYETIDIPVSINVQSNPPKLVWIKIDDNQKKITGEITIGNIFEFIVTLSNEGYGDCQLKAFFEKKDTPLRLFITVNSLKKGEKTELTLKLDSSKLSEPCKINNTLLIESNGGNISIPIEINVLPKKEIMIVLTIGFQFAYINDNPVKLDAPPYIKNSATMVPLRFISEAMKAKVSWENVGKGRIIIEMKKTIIQLDIGSTTGWVNGKVMTLSAAPEIVQSRTFVPLRFISESMGAQIEWEASTQRITIRFFED